MVGFICNDPKGKQARQEACIGSNDCNAQIRSAVLVENA